METISASGAQPATTAPEAHCSRSELRSRLQQALRYGPEITSQSDAWTLLRNADAFLEDVEKSVGSWLIAQERLRQVNIEGWTPEHDDEHDSGELADAAVTYAKQAYIGETAPLPFNDRWPWDEKWWKPSSPIRMLVKAGALIAAEIDRRLRAGEKP